MSTATSEPPTRTLELLLEELLGRLGPGSETLRVESTERSGGLLAECGRGAGHRYRAEAEVPGDPPWRLVSTGPSPAPLELAAAAEALADWRSAQRQAAPQPIAEREILDQLARLGPAARNPAELFLHAAATLVDRDVVEALVWASTGAGARVRVHAGHSPAPHVLARLVELSGYETSAAPPVEVVRVAGGSGARWEAPAEAQVVRVPLVRWGEALGTLLFWTPVADEGRRRLVEAAGNRLARRFAQLVDQRSQEQGRLRCILDSMPQSVILTDERGSVVEANPAGRKLLERSVSPGRLTRVGAVEIGEAPIRAETRLADGSIWQLSVSKVDGFEGEGEAVLWVAEDVSESRRLEEQLAQSEKLSGLGQMISGVAHELNNPLSSVVGYAQLVGRGVDDPRLARRLKTIGEEAERCRRIVRNFLGFARHHDPERSAVCLNELVRSTVGLVGYQCRVANVAIETELDPDLPPTEADPHQLQQLLINLLTNASQALETQGGGTVRIRTLDDGRGLRLTVSDDGPGVPEALRQRIFDPFFTTKEAGRGTGLGLSLAYGIVREHRGKISAETSAAGGARFVVELPAVAPRRRSVTKAGREATGAAPPSRILVVDDEPRVAELMRDALADEGHLVTMVCDREVALDELRTTPFDLIVLDLKMPGPAEGAFRERADELTGGRAAWVLVTGEAVGVGPEPAHPVLRKPFDLADLRRVVDSELERKDR